MRRDDPRSQLALQRLRPLEDDEEPEDRVPPVETFLVLLETVAIEGEDPVREAIEFSRAVGRAARLIDQLNLATRAARR